MTGAGAAGSGAGEAGGESRVAWAQWISPETLIAQVRNTAPFLWDRMAGAEKGRLVELGESADGFLRILRNWENIRGSQAEAPAAPPGAHGEQLQDYFALCLACHHATVATFVPTDVDTKIRGIVWRKTADLDVLRRMMRFALAARKWSREGVTRREVRGVSGLDGEHWSAIAGGLGRLLELGDRESAEEALAAIEEEIDREAGIFARVCEERDAELDVLRVAMVLAHNRGDLTQGMGFWKKSAATIPVMEHLTSRGRFAAAVRVYEETGMSAEGHRNYPLRAVRGLRRSAEWLIELPPFLDEWGARVARIEDGHEVLAALVNGCQKIAGQQGYFRAIAGMQAELGSGFGDVAGRMPNAAQRALRSSEMRKAVDVARVSFESMMGKRGRRAVASG